MKKVFNFPVLGTGHYTILVPLNSKLELFLCKSYDDMACLDELQFSHSLLIIEKKTLPPSYPIIIIIIIIAITITITH